jgi:hypothetical protein
VPKPIRWRFQLETSQVLTVTAHPVELRLAYENFYARMDKSGRITIPKLTLSLLQSCAHDQSLVGAVMEVSIEPAQLGSFFWGVVVYVQLVFLGFVFVMRCVA